MQPPPDAATIAGLLADVERRICFAAVQLGARTTDAVALATGSSAVHVAKAVGRLVSGGLLRAGDAGLEVAGSVFQDAAREARQRPASSEHDDLPGATRQVMKAFVKEGRIIQIPTSAQKRRVILDWLAEEFEPGRRYSESMVNLTLGQRHPDTAALRRYLVDEGILDRKDGQYWRSSGPVG